jgi:hypothetical protein
MTYMHVHADTVPFMDVGRLIKLESLFMMTRAISTRVFMGWYIDVLNFHVYRTMLHALQ